MVHIRLEEIEKYAAENSIPIMQKDGIEFLVEYIKKHNIKKILEIGTAIGYSAIKMALVDEDITVTTIERDKERYDLALKNISSFSLENRIKVLLCDALEVNLNPDDSYDLIFIDAAKSQYIKFFEKFQLNLKINGVIVSDNLSFHGLVSDESKIKNRNTRQLVRKIKTYKEYLKNNDLFITEFYEIGDGISVSKKKA